MLTGQQVNQYRQEGYTVARGILSPADVEAFRAEISRICKGNTLESHDKDRLEMEPGQPAGGTSVRPIYEPCTRYTEFRAFSESPALLDCVEQLLGPDILFHYSKINMKPPAIGSVVEWHQDLTYYPLTNPDSLAVLLYLDDADTENGCLQIIPGSHLEPPLDHTRDGYFQGKVTEPVDGSRAVPLEGEAGTAIFMHSLALHASVTNRSARPRRTLILSYRAADAFPIFGGDATLRTEPNVRLVRGRQLTSARFEFREFPVPRQRRATASLYELQELSRQGPDAGETPAAPGVG